MKTAISRPLRALTLLAGFAAAATGHASERYADRPETQQFIEEMQQRHGFDKDALTYIFRRAEYLPSVIKYISPPKDPGVRSWQRYRSRFIEPVRIKAGVAFWDRHADTIRTASEKYGVPEEIIVGIIGVETIYGRNTGNFQAVSALATLAFDYPPRAPFFRKELEQFLLMARENGVSPLNVKGSYAGAMGIPQFMPSSQRNFAVDFDRDDRIDLRDSTADAIGSVARFLNMHGWQPKAPIAVPATVTGDPSELIAAGIKPEQPLYALAQQGVVAEGDADRPAALIDLVTPNQPTEYWAGFDNFFVITRYNRSSFYAMSVFQLAEALREGRDSEQN